MRRLRRVNLEGEETEGVVQWLKAEGHLWGPNPHICLMVNLDPWDMLNNFGIHRKAQNRLFVMLT